MTITRRLNNGTDLREIAILSHFHYIASTAPNGNKYIRFSHNSGSNRSKRKFDLSTYMKDFFNYLTKTDEEFKGHIRQGKEEAV